MKHYMNTTLHCEPESIEQSRHGAESIIVPILFGIIFVVGFIANLVVILESTSITFIDYMYVEVLFRSA